MILYEGGTKEFINDTNQNIVADKLANSYETYYGRKANPREYNAWTNSFQFLKNVIDSNKLYDNRLILEYSLPYTSERIDCIMFGRGNNQKENVVVIELKQWSNVTDCDREGNVITFIAGANREEAHPSLQVRGYHYHLLDFMQMFEEEPPVDLHSCVYCHNYPKTKDSVLFLPKFREIVSEFPVYSKDDFNNFGDYLKDKLGKGKGLEIFHRFKTSNIKPSKKLIENTSHMIQGQKMFNLIDEQITANNAIIDRAKKSSKAKQKSVIIVRGGPGTGKSVIALNVLSELLTKGLVVFHATGSSAFTSTLRKVVGTRAAKLFKYFNSFQHTSAAENEIDVLICDEAHRIRKTSNSRYTKAEFRSTMPQIDELIRVAKVSIFFIDDYQVVRPDEIGSTRLIKQTAADYGAEIFDFELHTQFRCSGSDGYLNWIDNTLGIRETANPILTMDEKMEFKIFDSPHALYKTIKEKNKLKPNSARLVAGFCWPWSDAKPDGTLVEDVVIGDFKMTWEAKNDSARLAPGIPKAQLWAYDPHGVNQIGSIYTIQGFEFDFVGVIVGKDMMYDPIRKEWIGHPENSADSVVKRDKDSFLKNIKNTYRVLMTRGMKGCYVYFLDKETEEYFQTKIKI